MTYTSTLRGSARPGALLLAAVVITTCLGGCGSLAPKPGTLSGETTLIEPSPQPTGPSPMATPIEARVLILGRGGRTYVQSNSAGRFTIRLHAGTYRVRMVPFTSTDPGCGVRMTPVRIEPTRTANIKLECRARGGGG